ncbi:hypothetical protein [Mesorhizobium sp. BR1-1-3]
MRAGFGRTGTHTLILALEMLGSGGAIAWRTSTLTPSTAT